MTTSASKSIWSYGAYYGGRAGLVIVLCMTIGLQLRKDYPFFASETFGFGVMFLGLVNVFLGIRDYRNSESHRFIGFTQALLVGLAIVLAAAVIYVANWEVYLFLSDYKFMGEYMEGIRADKIASGFDPEKLEAEMAELSAFAEQYKSPLLRMPMTFMEIFPVGVAIAILSALVLRRSRSGKQS